MILLFLVFILLSEPINSFAASSNEACSKNLVPHSIQEIEKELKILLAPKFKCPDWITQKKELPACPKVMGNSTLPETYPKAFTIFGQTTNIESVYELIVQTYKKNPNQMPVFMISTGTDDLEKTMNRLKEQFPGYPWNEHLIHTYVGPYDDATTYIRDPFHSRLNSTNKVEVFQTRRGYEITEEMKAVFAACGIGVENPKQSKLNEENFEQTTLGGNFLTLLPGIHISTELTEIHDQSGWKPKNTIEIDYITNVRHIDEILQPVKLEYDSKGCPKVTALIASPDKALELIRKQAEKEPNSQAFDLTFNSEKYSPEDFSKEFVEFRESRHLNDDTRNVLHLMIHNGLDNPKALNGFHQICSAYRSMPDVSSLEFNMDEYVDVSFVFGEKRSRIIILDDSAPKSEVINLAKGFTKEQYDEALQKCNSKPSCTVTKTANPPVPPKSCAGLSAKDLYQVLKNTNYNIAESERLTKQTVELKKNIEQQISKKYPRCKNVMDWVDTPAILNDGSWALPNSTNSLPVTAGSIGMTDPYIKTFKDYLNNQMKQRNVDVTWFDTLGMNNFKNETKTGNLHCSTNSIPICDPKKR